MYTTGAALKNYFKFLPQCNYHGLYCFRDSSPFECSRDGEICQQSVYAVCQRSGLQYHLQNHLMMVLKSLDCQN